MDDITRWQKIKSRLFYFFPHHWISRVMFFLSRINSSFVVHPINLFIRYFDVDMSEAEHESSFSYPSFNAFFTRALKPEVREICPDPQAIASPCDGTVVQVGDCDDGQLIQAKGRKYALGDLLAIQHLSCFDSGKFCTLYLSPRDYHRLHMPATAELETMVHVPGRLFTVAPYATRTIDKLYTRNERVVCLFNTEFGKMALVMVGAVNVAAIETVWSGLVTPRGCAVTHFDYGGDRETVKLSRGDECARFNIGSSVVLLLENSEYQWNPLYSPGEAVRLGCEIARINR